MHANGVQHRIAENVIHFSSRVACKPLICLVTLMGVFLLAAGAGKAQESRATVIGVVKDSTGAVVPNVAIAIQSHSTGEQRSTKTNSTGVYTFPLLHPGKYVVTATAVGFEKAQVEITLDVHQILEADLQLKVGTTTTVISVQSGSPLLQTSDANVGQVIDAKRIGELPLVNGSPWELVFSTPGFSVPLSQGVGGLTSVRLQPDSFQATSSNMTANGMPTGSTEWTIDGVPDMTTTNANQGVGVAISPPTDSVQEFRAEIAYDASVGHTSGYIVNSVLKTGGEKFHGSGYLFDRPSGVAANTWADDDYPAGSQKPLPVFSYRRYGGSATGPIWIPKIYNGRRHGSFFAWSGEHLLVSGPTSTTLTVPTTKELSGDFTERLALDPHPAGPSNPYTVYDPATIALVGGVYTEQPMQCNGVYNVICPNRIDPVGKAAAALYPPTNQPGQNNGTENNYFSNPPYPDLYWANMLRLDQTVTPKQRFYVRFAFAGRQTGPYRNYFPSPAFGNVYAGNTMSGVADYTWTVNDSMVLDARYGAIYTASGHTPLSLGGLSKLPFSSTAAAELTNSGHDQYPYFSVQNGNPFGANPGTETQDYRNNTIHTAYFSVLKQIKRHSIAIGVDARAYRLNDWSFGRQSGNFNFGGVYTGSPTVGGSIPAGGLLGAAWASLLLGQPQSGNIDRNVSQADQSTYWGMYVQDNWKATDRLALNIGLRWEYYGPTTDRFNRAVSGFLPTAVNNVTVGAQAAYAAHPDPSLPISSFKATGGLIFAGTDGRRGFWERTNGTFAPRLGYAYRLPRSIVVRGGFGIFAMSNAQDGPATNASNGGEAISLGYSASTNFVPTVENGTGGLTFIGNLTNPFPTGVTPVSATNQGVNTYLGQSITYYQPNLANPYAMQWHQGVQFTLPSQILVEVDYQGNKAVKLELSRDANPLPNKYLTNNPTTPDAANYAYLYSQQIANPFVGLLPGSNLNNATITRSRLLVPYPQFSGITEWCSQGASWYHALVMRVDRRFADGYTLQASYVFSKNMDVGSDSGSVTSVGTYLNAGDLKPERGISALDQAHHFSITGLYDLPIGRGRLLLSSANGVTDRILGGWQLGGTFQFFTGQPIQFGTNFVLTGDIRSATTSNHPKVNSAGGAGVQWFNTAPFSTTISAAQLQGNLRVNPVYYSFLRGGGGSILNAGLHKSVPIAEGIVATFRFEAVNALNHPSEWSGIGTNPTAANFGQASGPGSDPRYLQFGGEVTF